MLASDKTASLAEPRHNHLVRRQVVQADGGGNNIYNGIDRSYLVKMHLIERHTVRFCFCFCKNLENPLCQSSRSRCQITAADNGKNLRQAAVLMMVMMLSCVFLVMAVCMFLVMYMLMIVRMLMMVYMLLSMCMRFRHIPMQIRHIMIVVLMLRIQNDIEVAGIQPRFFHSRNGSFVSRQLKACQCLLQYLLVCSQIEQSRNGHIPADSAPALQIYTFTHLYALPFC